MQSRELLLAITIALIWLPTATAARAEPLHLIAWWRFDESTGRVAYDSAARIEDDIHGPFKRVDGVRGKAIKFDGFTTCLTREADGAPGLSDAFSVEAWVATQAYPWNWCAIVNQEQKHRRGYFFGIDAEGRVGLHLAIAGRWRRCTSETKIPFMKWSYIVATFNGNTGIAVYVDGRIAGRLPVRGKPTFADDVDLQIGTNHTKLPPTALVREDVSFPTSYSFDGIIDEVKLYDRALSAKEIKQAYQASKPASDPPLEWRKLPQLPAGPSRFRAIYCRLKFYPEWDARWPVADHPDVVVTFDEAPYKMVFWRGTNYNMNLLTENGRWVADQSAEGGGADVIGCCEHMSDKQCRYAHVRVIENHDARVVVHWRYALCDVLYRIANVENGWGAWADEYYYIYPDGAAVRSFTVHGVGGCSITEPTVLNQPGEKAEDNVSLDAVTMANLKGQTRTHRWDPWPSSGEIAAPFTNAMPDANICIVNLKSQYKPFYVYEPGTRIIPYGGGTEELREDYSRFPTWNHWPVSQAPSDGRYALAPDRVSSSAITSPEPLMKHRAKDGALVGRFIMGLTDKPIGEVIPVARSWLQPPQLEIASEAYVSEGYSSDQRAYLLRNEAKVSAPLQFTLKATHAAPAVNPVFVIEDWGEADAELRINAKAIKRGKNFRFGHRRTLHGSDLIVWVRIDSTKAISISITPA